MSTKLSNGVSFQHLNGHYFFDTKYFVFYIQKELLTKALKKQNLFNVVYIVVSPTGVWFMLWCILQKREGCFLISLLYICYIF